MIKSSQLCSRTIHASKRLCDCRFAEQLSREERPEESNSVVQFSLKKIKEKIMRTRKIKIYGKKNNQTGNCSTAHGPV